MLFLVVKRRKGVVMDINKGNREMGDDSQRNGIKWENIWVHLTFHRSCSSLPSRALELQTIHSLLVQC